jgi:beta-phosphoglucomutase
MKYKAIIFDLDGVICSTDEYHFKAWKMLADKLGISGYSRSDNVRQLGISRMESLEVLLEKSDKQYTQEQKVELANYKNDIYRQMLSGMTPKDLSEEVKQTLDKIKASGIKIAIGSSSKNTPLILERLGLSDYFDAVSDGNNITHSKPHPEVFLKAAEFLGEKPSDCLVVEDAASGIDAAKAGGFAAAGLGVAFRYEKTDYPLNTFSALLKII